MAQSTKYIQADSVKLTPTSAKRDALTIRDDDGRLEALTELKPMLDSRGVKSGVAIVTSYVGADNYITWNQVM